MRESDKRWKAAIRIVGEAVGQQDILGLAGPNIGSISLRAPVGHHPALPHTDKVHGFGHWLANLLDAAVLARDGSWMMPYLGEAAQLAARRAREIGVKTSSPAPIPASTHSLAASELRGIIASSTQHGTRAAATALASKQRPLVAAREVAKSLHIGMQRSRLMTDYIVSKMFTHATIGIYRAAGVGQVGIIPERLRPRRRVRDARANLVSIEPESDDVVETVTADDDRVCQACQDISDSGPYSLDEAMELIPAHVNCRCAIVPTSATMSELPLTGMIGGLAGLLAEPGPPDVPITPEITPEEIEPELEPEPEEPGLEEEPLEEPEAEAKGIPGWMVGAAATLGGVALAALLSRGKEEPEAVAPEAEAAAAEEAPEDYPEFTGTTPQEYVDYAQQLFAWAVAMNWPVDALEERWDEDAEARARIGMDEDQESSLENQMAQASALLE
jgi:hypothetical protein